MSRVLGAAVLFFMVFTAAQSVSWAEYGQSSMSSGSLEEGKEEMDQMDNSMSVQPGDSLSSLENKGMDVQSGDAIDSEGTGAH